MSPSRPTGGDVPRSQDGLVQVDRIVDLKPSNLGMLFIRQQRTGARPFSDHEHVMRHAVLCRKWIAEDGQFEKHNRGGLYFFREFSH